MVGLVERWPIPRMGGHFQPPVAGGWPFTVRVVHLPAAVCQLDRQVHEREERPQQQHAQSTRCHLLLVNGSSLALLHLLYLPVHLSPQKRLLLKRLHHLCRSELRQPAVPVLHSSQAYNCKADDHRQPGRAHGAELPNRQSRDMGQPS